MCKKLLNDIAFNNLSLLQKIESTLQKVLHRCKSDKIQNIHSVIDLYCAMSNIPGLLDQEKMTLFYNIISKNPEIVTHYHYTINEQYYDLFVNIMTRYNNGAARLAAWSLSILSRYMTESELQKKVNNKLVGDKYWDLINEETETFVDSYWEGFILYDHKKNGDCGSKILNQIHMWRSGVNSF